MFKNIGKITEEVKKGASLPFAKGEYIFTVKEAIMGEADEKKWVDVAFVPTGNKIPQLTLVFEITKANGDLVKLADGTELFTPTYRFWVDDSNLGWNKKTQDAKKGRAIIAALLGVEPDSDIAEGLANFNALVSKQIQVFLGIEKTKSGYEKNVLLSIDPVKKN